MSKDKAEHEKIECERARKLAAKLAAQKKAKAEHDAAVAKAKAEKIRKIVAEKRAIEQARLAAIAKADAEEQAKVAAMDFGEAANYLRENDGKKAEEDAKNQAEKDAFDA